MMKLPTCLSTAVFCAALLAGPAFAADAMGDMPGMKSAPASSAKTGNATGVVTGVDAKAKTVTIKHGPIPAVGWPAMTMTFKANPPSLLNAVKPGDKVAFAVKIQGGSNEVTALRKQ